MFRCFPPSLLDRMTAWDYPPLVTYPGALALGPDATLGPITYAPADTVSSWTVFFRARAHDDAAIGKAWFAVTPAMSRIRNVGGTLSWTSLATNVAQVTSTVQTVTDRQWHSVAVAHNGVTGETRFFVDGNYIGSVTETLAAPSFSLGGRPDDASANLVAHDLKDFLFYRTRLLDEQINELHAGQYLKGSLEVFAPLNDPAPIAGSYLTNLAPTDGQLVVNSPNFAAVPSGVSVSDVVARELDLPAGKLSTSTGTLVYRKGSDGSEETLTGLVHRTGNVAETITGLKQFTSKLDVADGNAGSHVIIGNNGFGGDWGILTIDPAGGASTFFLAASLTSGTILNAPPGQPLDFRIANQTRLRVLANSSVLVGATAAGSAAAQLEATAKDASTPIFAGYDYLGTAKVTVGPSGNLGLNGAAPVAKGVITGSRGGNAALASLLTYLASRGDITDSTTA
jgi:hypothetical protein